MVTPQATHGTTAMITALRHASPLRTGLCAGRFELPVSDVAERLDALLGDLRGRLLRRIYCSPSLRCASLAALLAEHLGLAFQPDVRLMELDFGRWEGRAWDEITRNDRDRFEHWSANWQQAAPPGGERVDELERRVTSFLAELPAERVLVITHAGPIRAMRVVLTDCTWTSAMAEAVEYCVPVTIQGKHSARKRT